MNPIITVEITKDRGSIVSTGYLKDGTPLRLDPLLHDNYNILREVEARLECRDHYGCNYDVVAYEHSWKITDEGELGLK